MGMECERHMHEFPPDLSPQKVTPYMLGVWVGKDRLLSRERHLSDVLTCTVPPLRVESSLLKNPIPQLYSSKRLIEPRRVRSLARCELDIFILL